MKNLFIASSLLLLASCAATKKTARPALPTVTEAPAAGTQQETIATVLSHMNHIDYNTFTGKMDVDYAGGSKSYNLDAKIAMKKGELIWLSVTGPMSIEVARGIITRDSVKIITKLQKEYIVTSIDYLQDKFGLPLDLPTLQDLLIGNAVFISPDKSNISARENGTVQITSQTSTFTNLLTLLVPGYLPSVSNLKDVDATKNRNATLTYSDYKTQGSFSFPEKRNITVNYKKNITVGLAFKNYTFNQEISTPFSIPSNYKSGM